jgi:hypothetical protein
MCHLGNAPRVNDAGRVLCIHVYPGQDGDDQFRPRVAKEVDQLQRLLPDQGVGL